MGTIPGPPLVEADFNAVCVPRLTRIKEISSGANGNHSGVAVSIKDDDDDLKQQQRLSDDVSGCGFLTVPFIQKIIAEALGTYFLIFAGCAAVVVNADKDKVPAYIAVQVLAATLASGTLRLLFNGRHDHFAGTLPNGSDVQSLVVEFIITFYLMFVISGVATDNRAIGELAGLAVGATILLNVMIAGPISGASMNPARSLGPAIVSSNYRGLWIYMLGPTAGAIAGAWVYNIIRFTDKPLREITKSASFLRSSTRSSNSK
ncbi:UNVERIFIED_CONTAM: Aquaporin NIP1-1 [Sesamum calycinum]|uniref:Aquaporin NIP1-1 n=1 Tax=Sesamum calycinum TaxID=2727403 RepID=A0AAW2Q7M3_9LAMI